MQLIDTHAHLDFPELYGDLNGVFERARDKGVIHIVTVGISLETSEKALKLAENYENVSATAGIHPHGAHLLSSEEKNQIKKLLSSKHVVAMGEIGLDYYRDYQPRDIQKRCFIEQMEIASELNKPVVFHVRQAFDDFLEIVKPFSKQIRTGIVHCFSGDWQIAKLCLEMGFFISVPGVVTFSKASTLQNVVKKVPLDSLLVETDAPFLAPEPYRGKPNEPSYVWYTAKKIAELRDMDMEEIGAITTRNAIRAFDLDISS